MASDLPVLREVFGAAVRFGAGPRGLADELRQALAHPDPRRRAAGRALAASHTWQAAAQAHLTLYRALADPAAVGATPHQPPRHPAVDDHHADHSRSGGHRDRPPE